MAAQYYSKHGIVSRPQTDLYMMFTDLRNFTQMLPEDKKKDVTADFDTLTASIRGFNIGIRITNRHPYDRIVIEDNGAPFSFMVVFHFDEAQESGKTDFSIELEADLNLMMKMTLGKKLQQALDSIVDGMVAMSEGRMPEGVDPSMFSGMNFPS